MNLDIFSIKDEKIIGFLFKDGCIFVKFYLILVYVHHFSDFQFVGGDSGLKSRKQSMNRLRGMGITLGGCDQKSNITRFEISRGWH